MNFIFKQGKFLAVAIALLAFIGCGDDDEVLPAVVASFTQEIDQMTGTVTFTNTSQNATSFSWDFGNGSTSTQANPTQTYVNGEYTVTLTASNVAGSSDTATATFTITIPDEMMEFDSGLIMSGDFEGGTDGWTVNFGDGTVPTQTDGGNTFFIANVETATPDQPFLVNLSQVVEIVQGTNYILTFDASSDRERSIIAGIGLNEDPFTNSSTTVNLTTETQTFTLQLSATDFGSENSRILFDLAAEAGVVVIDNVSLVEGGDGSDSNPDNGSEFDSGLLTNGDFENGTDPWFVNFGDNTVPTQTDGGNTFFLANIETAVPDQPFLVNLSQVVEIVQGTNYILKFDASSDRERTLISGIGLNEAPFTNSSPVVNLTTETQTFELQLTAADFGSANSRVLFDMAGDAGVVVIDNVSLVEGGDGSDSNGGGDGGSSQLLTNGDFENGTDPWFVNFGDNTVPTQTDGGNTFFLANVESAVPDQPFLVNLSQVVEIVPGTNYTLTFDASSDRARTIIAGIGLNEAPFTNTAPTVNLTTETQTITLQLSAADFGGANSRVLFDLAGDAGVVVIDNVSLEEGGDGSDSMMGDGGNDGGDMMGELLMNGDFENGTDPWFVNFGDNTVPTQTDGGNTFFLANVESAVPDQPFLVNLSQVVAITQGSTYTLAFDASSDRDRTIIAGIGLNEAPFTNNSQTINLTTTTERFTLELTATDFGIPNSRVLFDLAGDAGVVVIDNVSLTLNSSGGGSDTVGFSQSFDDAASISTWERVADATSDEASLEWDASAGNPDGAMRVSGTNPVDTAGKAYIFQTVENVSFGGASSATLTFDLKLEGDLTAAAIQLQTEVQGVGVVDTADLQNNGLNADTWTTYTVQYDGVMDGNFRMALNIAAGAVVDAGGTILVDNINLTAN